MAKWLSQTPDVARDSYDSILPSFSLDGGTVDKTYRIRHRIAQSDGANGQACAAFTSARFNAAARGAEGIEAAVIDDHLR